MIPVMLGLWLCAIFCACMGYGKIMLILPRAHGASWGVAGGLGLSLLVFIGAWLNLFQAVSSIAIVCSVLPGTAACIFFLLKEHSWSALIRYIREVEGHPQRLLIWSLVAFIVLLTAVRVIGQIRPSYVDFNDDRQAYLAFPTKMLATHSFAPDPFSERRVTSTVGGYTYLSTLPLVIGDVRSIAMMDQGLGFLLLMTTLAAAIRLFRLAPLYGLLLLACVAITPIYRHNATAALIGAALIAGLLLTILDPSLEDPSTFRRAIFAGILMGTVCTQKSTFIPAAFLIYGCYALLTLFFARKRFVRKLAGHFIAVGTAALFLLPWCLAMKSTSGTALYPLLGHGFHVTAYGILPHMPHIFPYVARLRLLIADGFLIAILIAVLKYFGLRDALARSICGFLIGSAVAAAFIGYVSFPSSFWRYIVPFAIVSAWFAAMILMTASNGADSSAGNFRRNATAISLALISLVLARGGGRDWSDLRYHGVKMYWKDLRSTLRNEQILRPDEVDEVRQTQDAIPAGATFIARLDNNFAEDFSRNSIFILDTPGMAGPPPGPPLGRGAEAWARYLKSQSIQYIAFSRATAIRGFSPGLFSSGEGDTKSPLYDPAAALSGDLARETDRDFVELSHTKKVVFDDGKNVVIDLE